MALTKITKRPLYSVMDGIIYPADFSPKCFSEVLNYKPRSDDVFIITYPKCGTTWMQNVALYIFRKGQELEDTSLFRKYCPFIDMTGEEGIHKMPRPGALKTHVPFNRFRYSPEAKYVFVARNPKDTVVSFYHHTTHRPEFGYWDATFDDFFELFIAGEVEYNEYYDHLFSWYPYRNDPNVFYTTYEEMKRDIKGVIINLAKFLGDEFINAIEQDNSVLNNIIEFSGFEYMKKHLFKTSDSAPDKDKLPEHFTYEGLVHCREHLAKLDIPENLPEMQLMRKGIVGDWRNVLSEEQSERMDEKFVERTKGTEIHNWFS